MTNEYEINEAKRELQEVRYDDRPCKVVESTKIENKNLPKVRGYNRGEGTIRHEG